MNKCLKLILSFMIFSIILFMALSRTFKQEDKRIEVRTQLFQVIGITTLAVSQDCTSTRGIIECVWGCLGDVPGGYCYHASCDIVSEAAFTEEEYYRIEKP